MLVWDSYKNTVASEILAVALTYNGFQCPWNYDFHEVTLPASAKKGLVMNLAKTFLYRIELIFLKKTHE